MLTRSFTLRSIALGPLWLFATLILCQGARAQQSETYAGRTVDQWTQTLNQHVDKDTAEDKEETRRAAQALGLIGPPARSAVPALAAAIPSRSIEVRHFAVDALGRIGPDAASSIPAILEEANLPKDHRFYAALTEFRQLAARAMGRMGPAAEAAVPVLKAALENEDPIYRVEAALALWRINGDETSIKTIESLIPGDEGAFEAVMAIRQMGPAAEPAIPALLSALRHDQPDVRRAAAKTLIEFGTEVIDPLAQALADPACPDPRPIAFALGALFRQQRDAWLEGSRPIPQAVNIAGKSLAGMLASPDASTRQTAERSLAEMGLMGVPYALAAMQQAETETRQASVRALVRIEPFLPSTGTPKADLVKKQILTPLMQLMRQQDPQVQAAAFRAFAVLDFGDAGSEAIPLLRGALRNPDVAIRRHAAKALEQYEDQ